MKGFVMNKKGPVLLLLALLTGLPGCGPEKGKGKQKKDTSKKMTRKMVQYDEFTDMSMPLADADDEMSDDSINRFFSDMEEEFVAFNDDFDTDEMTDDQLRWDDSDNVSSLETVYFPFGKDKVDDDQNEKMELNADEAKQLLADAQEENADAKLIVEGHACASAGSPAYNLALSEKRANAVADRLAESGIDREVMKVVGRGYEMPILKDGTRDEQWVNRRVELHVVQI